MAGHFIVFYPRIAITDGNTEVGSRVASLKFLTDAFPRHPGLMLLVSRTASDELLRTVSNGKAGHLARIVRKREVDIPPGGLWCNFRVARHAPNIVSSTTDGPRFRDSSSTSTNPGWPVLRRRSPCPSRNGPSADSHLNCVDGCRNSRWGRQSKAGSGLRRCTSVRFLREWVQ